jgi:hypothetical protein
MKNYEITEEQIKEIETWGSSKVKEWFPEVFETKLEVGKWYKSIDKEKHIFCVTELKDNRYYYYGFDVCGGYKKEDWYSFMDCGLQKGFAPATDLEALEALKNEFEKRNPNIRFNMYGFKNNTLKGYNSILEDETELFKDGVFTKFHTKEEAEKLLNAKII